MNNRSVRRISQVITLSIVVFLLTCIHQAFAEDVITLNSQEIIKGRIVSETDKEITIEVGNYNHTIFSTKIIAKTDIKTVERETAEEKKEKDDYAVLSKYNLNPNQEFTEAQYKAGIAAFNKFLLDYPKSQFADTINRRVADWNAELSNLQSGKVKFADQWMTADEKRIASDKWRKDKRVQDDLVAVQNLRHQLEGLQLQRKQAVEGVGLDQAKLGAAQAQLANLQDQTTVTTIGVGGGNGYWAHNKNGVAYWVPTGQRQALVEETTPNPDRAKLAASVGGNQGQVAQGQMVLNGLDNQIAATQSKLNMAENEYKAAEAQAQVVLAPTPTQVVVVAAAPPPSPPPPSPVAPPPPEEPWYSKNWKWIAGGVGLAGVMFALVVAGAIELVIWH